MDGPGSDSVKIDQYDVMRYEQLLSEFLNQHSDFEDRLSEWRSGITRSERMRLEDAPESEMASANQRDAHPLLYRIATTREETNQWFTTGELKMLLPVIDVINAGRAIEIFDELDVIEAGTESDTGIDEEYVNRLLNEDETLDALFELEVAAIFHRDGFDTKLVKEGNIGGRDIVVTEDSTEISIECKRKSMQIPFDKKMEITGRTISDKVWNQIDIGRDSFAIRISSDTPPEDEHVVEIADEIATVLQNRLEESSITVDGDEFRIELIDYYEGGRLTDYSGGIPSISSEVDNLREEIDPLGHLDHDIDPMDTDGHGDVQIFVNELGQVVVMNAYIMEFDFPKYEEIELNDWVMNTVRSASSQLSDHAPGVIFMDLPYIVIEQMQMRQVESYHGGEVTQWERLVDEQIIGLLNKSTSLNAVVFSSHCETSENGQFEMGRPIQADSPIHSIFNIDPEEELPPRFKSFIEGSHVTAD